MPAPAAPARTLAEHAEAWEILTVEQAAPFLGLSVALVRQHCKEGRMPGLLPRVGRAHRISARGLLAWLENAEQANAAVTLDA